MCDGKNAERGIRNCEERNLPCCPVCGELICISSGENEENNEYEAAEIVSTMMITGIL